MNVHISYKLQRTPDIDKEMQHWTGKIQKRLQVFRPELIHLKGSVEQNSAREGTTVSLNLRLPSGQMAVQESAHALVLLYASVKRNWLYCSAFTLVASSVSSPKDSISRISETRVST